MALIGAFIVWEGVCKFPMMPLRIWKDRNFSLVMLDAPLILHYLISSQINIVVAFGFMSFNTCAFWLSLYMQDIMGYSPLEVAVRLLPQAIGGTIVNIIAGLILHRVNNVLLTGIAALCLFLAALLLTVMKDDSPYWPFMFPSMILSVIGVDLEFNVAFVSSPARARITLTR
jgi:predicted MFS family arabinose efflux permease